MTGAAPADWRSVGVLVSRAGARVVLAAANVRISRAPSADGTADGAGPGAGVAGTITAAVAAGSGVRTRTSHSRRVCAGTWRASELFGYDPVNDSNARRAADRSVGSPHVV